MNSFMSIPSPTRIPDELLLAVVEALALLPNIKPRLALQLLKNLKDDFDNDLVVAIAQGEPWAEAHSYESEVDDNGTPVPDPPDPRQRELKPGVIVTAAEIEEGFTGDDLARVTPEGAALLIRLYEAELFDLQPPHAGRGDPARLRAYAASRPDLLALVTQDEEARRARKALVQHPERIAEADFTYELLNHVFIEHHGLQGGITRMEIGGLLVTKEVFTYPSNSGKSHDSNVTFSWVSQDGTPREVNKPSMFSGNRRNDPDRNWGLGPE
jgi:hypothetical protein